jgi:hypothetical protein
MLSKLAPSVIIVHQGILRKLLMLQVALNVHKGNILTMVRNLMVPERWEVQIVCGVNRGHSILQTGYGAVQIVEQELTKLKQGLSFVKIVQQGCIPRKRVHNAVHVHRERIVEPKPGHV